ncbi:MAG: LPS assembly lipoprotein LptE [Tannerellaceae bacterium]|nr:LPS assembly lipoprotein LptE [Tannerellaceae bacterium]
MAYRFNAASIDYNIVSSISIGDFPNRAPLVYPPLSALFSEKMKDKFVTKTKLSLANENGNLNIDGNIIAYELSPMAVKEDAWASETKLTITVLVKFTNEKNHDKDFERNFSAYRNFPSTSMLTEVESELCDEIVDEIVDAVFNATVADW